MAFGISSLPYSSFLFFFCLFLISLGKLGLGAAVGTRLWDTEGPPAWTDVAQLLPQLGKASVRGWVRQSQFKGRGALLPPGCSHTMFSRHSPETSKLHLPPNTLPFSLLHPVARTQRSSPGSALDGPTGRGEEQAETSPSCKAQRPQGAPYLL